MAATTRIVIADRQESVRVRYRRVLDAQPDMTVVGEATDGWSAVGVARHLRPDIVLVEVDLAGPDRRQAARTLVEARAGRVIMMSTVDRSECVTDALLRGASGFLLKPCGAALLVEAVRAAMVGNILISPQVTARLLRKLAAATDPHPVGNSAATLTGREADVARAVAAGRTNAEIAAELHITAGTVKTHLANMQTKLGVRNRVGIAAWAWTHGHAAPAPAV
jgi:DNA-binding NarL/FixJ family response regulator